MSRTFKWIAVLACFAVLAAAWLAFRPHARPAAPVAAAAPPVVARPAVAHVRAVPPAKLIEPLLPKRAPPANAEKPERFDVRSPPGRLDLVVAEVTPAAEAGDAAAMRTLGEVLTQCNHADMRNDEAIEKAAAKQSLDIEQMQKRGVPVFADGETDPARIAVRIADSMKLTRDSCRRIPAAELKAAGIWIARAAQAGDERAALDRAGRLLHRIDDRSVPLEERDRLRARMNAMLQDEIAKGHCNNMVLNMLLQESGDPMLAYIYGGILMRRGIATIDSVSPDQRQSALESAQRELRRLAAELPPEQLPAAEATRDYIEANYCRNWQ